MKPTSRDYCQFLISTQVNYTQTNFANHHPSFSHDAINRYLQDANLKPADVWNLVKDAIEYDDDACLVFDDSVQKARSDPILAHSCSFVLDPLRAKKVAASRNGAKLVQRSFLPVFD